jgi:hypothetical protein
MQKKKSIFESWNSIISRDYPIEWTSQCSNPAGARKSSLLQNVKTVSELPTQVEECV